MNDETTNVTVYLRRGQSYEETALPLEKIRQHNHDPFRGSQYVRYGDAWLEMPMTYYAEQRKEENRIDYAVKDKEAPLLEWETTGDCPALDRVALSRPSIEENYIRAEQLERLKQYIRKQDPFTKEIFRLYYGLNYSERQISYYLHLPRCRVRACRLRLVHDAKQYLNRS